jgi:hypothetical protein
MGVWEFKLSTVEEIEAGLACIDPFASTPALIEAS